MSFVLDGDLLAVIDPGLVPGRGAILEDISTLVDTDEGLVVFTHLWWTSEVPVEDPYATDPAGLHANRERVLALPGLATIVPGHGAPFVPGAGTPV